MGIAVMVIGESGAGKSASIRNFKPDEVGILNVANKPLPFRSAKFKTVNFGISDTATKRYEVITGALKRNSLKRYVIDDSQYLLSFELFDRVSETGYGKFTEMAVKFYSLIRTAIDATTPDTVVYFLHHTEEKDGFRRAKTVGKMLDEKLTVEGLFSIVLFAAAKEDKHVFITQSDGKTTAKSPMGMFPLEIDNDLKMVDDKIREYYGL